eukprot:g7857.t1
MWLASAVATATAIARDERPGGGGGCPVRQTSATSAQPAAGTPTGDGNVDTGGKCPMRSGGRAAAKKNSPFNVYSQPIDPSNQMPFNPNQEPHQSQTAPISTERVRSTIPKGNTEGQTWTYPSPQMFYNALRRKGKGEDAEEAQMDMVVAIHNNMNERAWRRVAEWENALHPEQASPPALLRFLGRPHDLSPKARLLMLLGLRPEPFDRHDWTIQRADGEEVRYVIDYYFDENAGKHDTEKPQLEDEDAVRSITFDVRPALDSVGACVDRARMAVRGGLGIGGGAERTAAPAPAATAAAPAAAGAAAAAFSSAAQGAGTGSGSGSGTVRELTLSDAARRVDERCAPCRAALERCDGEEACAKASIGLTFCMARELCKTEAAAFEDAASEETFDAMNVCLTKWQIATAATAEVAAK